MEKQPAPNSNLVIAVGLLAGVVSYLNWESAPMAFAAAGVTAVSAYIWMTNRAAGTAVQINNVTTSAFRWFRQLFRQEEVVHMNLYDIALGHEVGNGRWVVDNLKRLKSMAVWGVNGSGKTSFIHSLVHFIIKHYPADLIQLAFSDLKEVDYFIYRRLPHLYCPIATTVEDTERMIQLLEDEMKERSRCFRSVATGATMRLCNDIDRYHALRDEYGREDLPVLPLVLAIFDEISTFTARATTLDRLILLAEKGRAYGIFLIVATQFPKVDAIPSRLREQCPTRFVGRMSSRSYTVAGVYKEDWDGLNLKTRQFLASLGSVGADYIVLQGQLIPYEELESVANAVSNGHTEPTWPDTGRPVAEVKLASKLEWSGTDEEKAALLFNWFGQFDDCPTVDDWLHQVNASRRTYYSWVPEHWAIYQG